MADLQYLPLKEDWVSGEVFSASNLNEITHTINELGELAEASVGQTIQITYDELFEMCTGGTLVPGQTYQITDYQCTTTQEGTQSAGNQFDIIVTADTIDSLNERVNITHHSGDTYFENCNLEAWEAKYSIYNDVSRFEWADSGSTGRGVIYYLKDDLGNECAYDFKNIMFELVKVTGITWNSSVSGNSAFTSSMEELYVGKYLGSWFTMNHAGTVEFDTADTKHFYTFSLCTDGETFEVDDSGTVVDGSMRINTSDAANIYRQNVIPELIEPDGDNSQSLNYIVFKPMTSDSDDCFGNIFGKNNKQMTIGYSWSVYNSFGNYCYSNTFGNDCGSNIFGNECYSNSFGNDCISNSFGNYCNNNSFGNSCYENSFGNVCYFNSFGNECVLNTFGNDCGSNIFGNECYSNSFGNYCNSNSFGNECSSNSFGNECYDNSFDVGCYNNNFGRCCDNNTFGVTCGDNIFGGNMSYCIFSDDVCFNIFGHHYNFNILGEECERNLFGNYCMENNVGDYFYGNSIGNDCMNTYGANFSANKLGNGCLNNVFGESCKGNSLGNLCQYNQFGKKFSNNTLGNGISYLDFTQNYPGTGSSESGVTYIQVLNGYKYGSLTAVPTGIVTGATYCQYVGYTSAGTFMAVNPLDNFLS